MKQEERKLRVKRMLAGVMSAMLLISAADVSGWGSVVMDQLDGNSFKDSGLHILYRLCNKRCILFSKRSKRIKDY